MNKSSELDILFTQIGTYRKSKQLMELFEFIKKFPRIAAFNAMLINIQKPGSVYVTSAKEWDEKFNRNVIPGKRPLLILMPFGPVSFVYDFFDTEGTEPFPQELLEPFRVNGTIGEYEYSKMLSNLLSYGIRYIESDLGTNLAGYIRWSEHKHAEIKRTSKYEYQIICSHDMVVNSNHNKETKFATILHELGHLFCGHLGSVYKNSIVDRHHLDEKTREFEAECVCWLVCERAGVENPSAEYLSHYVSKFDEIPPISIDTVLKSVTVIEKMMKKGITPRKEVIEKKNNLN